VHDMLHTARPRCHSFTPQDCCKALHDRRRSAETPEELLRSRFAALCAGNLEYLVDTCHPESLRSVGTRQANLNFYKRLLNRNEFISLEDIQVQEPRSSSSSTSTSTSTREVHVFYTAAVKEQGLVEVLRKPYEDVFLQDGSCWVFYSSKVVTKAASAAGSAVTGGFAVVGFPRFIFRDPEPRYVDTWNGDGRYVEDEDEDEDEIGSDGDSAAQRSAR
jgi:uncharacterized protein YchJ